MGSCISTPKVPNVMVNEYCSCGFCPEGVIDCELLYDFNTGRMVRKIWFNIGVKPAKRRNLSSVNNV